MNAEDQIFWDRIEQMPAWEAEQECVMRREHNALQLAMLKSEQSAASTPKERTRIGAAVDEIHGQFTLLNERIKYLRKLQDRLQWKRAVQTLFGQEAYEQCVVWLEQEYGHIADERRSWDGKPPVRLKG
jgi:hypothetical protein